MSEGLQKKARQYVHLSEDIPTFLKAARRQGKPILIKIESLIMYKDGFEFFKSDNNVWLTETVPVTYLKISET